MMQVTYYGTPVLRRNVGTLPISGHGSSSQSSQPTARQSMTSLTLAILRRFSYRRGLASALRTVFKRA